MLLTIPSAVLLWQGQNYLAYAVGLAAYATDLLDGWLARKLNEVSELGKIIDPLADKIYVAVITIVLVVQERLPPWFVTIIVVRDIVIMLAGIYLSQRIGFVMPSNTAGKIAVVCVIVVMSCAVLNAPQSATMLSIVVALGMLGISSGMYAIRFVQALRGIPTSSSRTITASSAD